MNYLEIIIKKYHKRGLLVDSNLLLMYFVGQYENSRIETFKRTSNYTVEDFYLLSTFIKHFKKLITTPNILTEVSNLSTALPKKEWVDYFQCYSDQISVLTEFYNPSSGICTQIYFDKFGLTDSGMINLVKGQYLVLSDDLPLVHYMGGNGIDAINFNHLRFQDV